MFLPFICLSAVNIVCWRFLAFACASGCFVAWRLVLRWYVSFMPLFARFVRVFVGLLLLSFVVSLSGGRRLCVCCLRRFLRFVRLFLTAVCVFQRFCVNWCFSYCLLSFACLGGLFCVICLSLPLIAHFCVFLYAFLYALRVACFFSHCLLGFARLGGLFCVICLSLPLIAHFFVRFESCLSFFRIACCWFSCLDAFSSLSV